MIENQVRGLDHDIDLVVGRCHSLSSSLEITTFASLVTLPLHKTWLDIFM
jgi:hypothetical protein